MINLGKILSELLPNMGNAAKARRRQEREIRSMEARELCDLGIGASEIPSLFRAADNIVRHADPTTAGKQFGRNGQRSFKRGLVLQQQAL